MTEIELNGEKIVVTIEPLGERVAVIPDSAERVLDSGIVIPDTVSGDKPQMGTIICVSPKVTELKAGDKVLFGKYAGDDIKMTNANNKQIEVKILLLESILAKSI